MPAALVPAIAAAGAAIGGATGAFLIMNAAAVASATVTLGLVGANAALSRRQQRRAAAQQRAAYNASLKDRELMIRSAIAPRRIVLGRDRISGPIVYAQSTGAKGEYLHLVIALAHGQSDAIEEVWFNDVQLPLPDAGGFINSGEFAANTVTSHTAELTTAGTTLTLPHVASRVTSVSAVGAYVDLDGQRAAVLWPGWTHTPPSATVGGVAPGTYWVNYETTVSRPLVRIKKHLGGAGQVADADLVAESGGKWTVAHVGHGVTYLYVRLEYEQDVWGQVGIPNISVVLRGSLPWDPRTGLNAWTDNAALVAAHWLRHPLGLAADSAQVPPAELTAEANLSDESVALNAGGLTHKRYTFNGSFGTDESPRDVLEDILSCMAGSAVWVQGRWLLRAGAYRTPAPTLDEAALAGGGVSIVPRASRSELFNAVRVTHRDRSQGWAEVQAPLVTNAGYEAADGGRQLVRSITLPGEMDTWRAQRLGKILLERARQAVTVQLSTNLRGYNLLPTDNVPLALARYGWAGKVFEVRRRTYDPLGTLQYTLVETAAGVWAWNYGEATVGDLAPDTVLPNPYSKPAALTGLAVDAGPSYILRGPGGQLTARALVVWVASTDVFVLSGGRIEVQWKRTRDAEWQPAPPVAGHQTQTVLAPMPDGDAILVRVRAVNAAGRASDWATEAENVVQTALYAKTSLVDATWWRPGAAWEWPRAEDVVGESSIVWGSGPRGESMALWQAIAAGPALTGPDGGWNVSTLALHPKVAFAVDVNRTYRFALPVRRSSGSGPVYWGPSPSGVVCHLNTATPIANPYGWAADLPALGRWYLIVFYVFPAGSAGLTHDSAGLFDMETGAKVGTALNFCWAAGAAECGVRAFQFYNTTGATTLWAPPQVQVLDGYDAARISYIGQGQVGYPNLAPPVAADLSAALSTAAAAQATADGKIDSFWQASAPLSASEGDLWFDTDDGNRQYRWTSGAWVAAADTRIGTAISAAATAQATADGKVVTFVQASAPTAEAVGDLWIESDNGNRLYRWSGSSWDAVPLGSAAIATGGVATGNLADHSVTSGLIEDSSQVVGSSGSPGASVRVATVWGPTITTEAGDELDITVAGLLNESFWSQAALAYVELWLTHAPTFGGAQTEFGARRRYLSPVDVYTVNNTWFSLDMHGQITPGAVTRDYVLRVSIAYRDAAGAAKQCGKDYTVDAQWRVVRRKR